VRQRLVVSHLTSYQFAAPAGRLSLALRLWPEPYAGLLVREWQVSVGGEVIRPNARTGYGERTALWTGRPSAAVEILATGVVDVEDRAGVVSGLTTRVDPMLFLRSTRRTKADKAIRDLGGAGPASPDTVVEWLHALMRDVRARVAYVTGATDIATSAADALAGGQGVCQDHSHIFIATARAHGIPARYVCGYLLAASDAMALHETHAWVEVYIEKLGWVGFDPSNGLCPTDRYVRLTVGLDAVDAAPIRGTSQGASATGLFADVRIAPSAGGAAPEVASIANARRQSGMQQQ
jgi:transglutaminase-like putative cysteine protease